jgi:class 3 adenylate cyclase
VSVPVRARDDIGNLVQSFNDMTAGLALKEKYRRFLNMFTDPKVAEEVLRSDIVLGGEQREVSVLFCDIRGFTGLTPHMAPPAVMLLNDHTDRPHAHRAHHGVVDKFVGDRSWPCSAHPPAMATTPPTPAVPCASRPSAGASTPVRLSPSGRHRHRYRQRRRVAGSMMVTRGARRAGEPCVAPAARPARWR